MASLIWIRRLGSALWLLTACSPAGGAGDENGVDTDTPAGAGSTGAGGTADTPAGGGSRPANDVSPSGMPGSGSIDEGGITPVGNVSTSKVPCDVAAIVADHCTTCHGATPAFNAPMS